MQKEKIAAERKQYVLGVDVEAKDGDFGANPEPATHGQPINAPGFMDAVEQSNIEAVFAGHFHAKNTCITYKNVKWVYGLKTGQYDYHTPGQLGGTLVTLEADGVEVAHVPSLAKCAPFPGGARIFKDFFVEVGK